MWYASSDNQGDQTREKLASYNLFLGVQQARLQVQAPELERVLEFMVWPSVEQPMRRRLLELYRQQVNRSPFDGQLWQKILYQQSYLADPGEQLNFIFGRVMATSGWKHKVFVNLAYYCVNYADVLDTETNNACNKLLANAIGQHRARRLPQVLGLNPQQVELILRQAEQSL